MPNQSKLTSTLQPHQQRVVDRISRADQPGLVVAHSTGRGKTLSSIAAHHILGQPADIVVPASLRGNYAKEMKKHISGKAPDVRIHSLQAAARGKVHLNRPVLIVDESHWSRNAQSNTAKALSRSTAKKRLFLTASPLYNHPSDIAPLVNMAAGHKVLPESKVEFEKKYFRRKKISPGLFGRFMGVQAGEELTLHPHKIKELKKITSKWVDYAPAVQSKDFPSHKIETVHVPMSQRQQGMHDFVLGKAPKWVAWKVKHGLPPSKQEAKQLNAFMGAARQVSNSTAGFHTKGKVDSPKVEAAFHHLQRDRAANPNHRAVVYSSFLRSGIEPYKRKLEKAGVPYGEFTGSVPKRERDSIVKDYNSGKKPVLLISRAGAEGLDLKGTRSVQVMEPHWNEEMVKQVIGRGVRYKSHEHLPESQRHVKVERFVTGRRPQGLFEEFGLKKPGLSTDQYVSTMARKKESVNKQFRQILESQNKRLQKQSSLAKLAARKVPQSQGKLPGLAVEASKKIQKIIKPKPLVPDATWFKAKGKILPPKDPFK